MKVMKFGGSSVALAERIERVAAIVDEAQRASKIAVVVSAMGGVTDALAEGARLASMGLEDYREALGSLKARHLEAAERLAPTAERGDLSARIERRFEELGDLLHGVLLVRECSPRTRDQVLSYGERLSADLLAAALRSRGVDATYLDARRLVVTDKSFGAARVDTGPTYQRLREHFAERSELQVVTGFLGASAEGETTTLGRGGSDYTASLLGAALEAEAIEIWTDVDGVMSADPRLVPEAFLLPELAYEELMELSHFGAKVVYPPTIHPARASRIPLIIKNTFRPERPGTRIAPDAPPGDRPVRGISSIHDIALLRLEGDGMLGVPGTARRLFEALAREQVNVILITQASSEHSICFAVAPGDVDRARLRVEEEFALERRAGLIDELVVERDLAIVAAVGVGMRERPGIAGKLFRVLGDEGVNVRAIAQGSSELNISLALARDDETRALCAIHRALFASGRRPVQIFFAGPASLRSALSAQIASAHDRSSSVDLRLSGLDDGEPEDLASFIEAAPGVRVFVDATASSDWAALYPRLLEQGVAVVTSNLLPFARSMKEYEALRRWRGRLHYGSGVSPSLPVLRVVESLVETGDEVESLEAAFADGDASGRKLLVLARAAGFPLEPGRVSANRITVAGDPDGREDRFVIRTARHRDPPLVMRARSQGAELLAAGLFTDILQACVEKDR